MSGHTPGPWTIDGNCIVGPGKTTPEYSNHVVCDGSHWWDTPGDIPNKDDLALIAAAPELLEALKDLTARCDGDEGVRADGSNIQTMAAHAAIAKAEGRS